MVNSGSFLSVAGLITFAAGAVQAAPAPDGAPVAVDLGIYHCKPLSRDEGNVCATDADYSAMVWSDHYEKIFLKGGGHAATNKTNVKVFDSRDLAWHEPFPSTPCADLSFANLDPIHGRWISSNQPVSRHDYDLIAAVGDKLVLLSKVQGRGSGCTRLPPVKKPDSPYVIAKSTIAFYTPKDGSWTYTDIPAFGYKSAAEFDPVSGKILIAGKQGLWWFDPAAGRLDQFKKLNLDAMGWGGMLVYASNTDKFYWLATTGKRPFTRHVFEIAIDRSEPAASTVTQLETVIPSEAGPGWAYDPGRGVIGGGVRRGVFYVFDPRSRQIGSVALRSDSGVVVGDLHGYAIAYVPPLHGYVFRTRSHRREPHTFLYRPPNPVHHRGVGERRSGAAAGSRATP